MVLFKNHLLLVLEYSNDIFLMLFLPLMDYLPSNLGQIKTLNACLETFDIHHLHAWMLDFELSFVNLGAFVTFYLISSCSLLLVQC